MSYVYIESESPREYPPGLWTVGFYDHKGRWQPESDHGSPKEAEERVNYLHGCKNPITPRLRDMVLDGLHTDGAHHKQWFLQEIAKILGIDYSKYNIEEGITP